MRTRTIGIILVCFSTLFVLPAGAVEKAATPTASPFTPTVKFTGFVQYWATASDAVYDMRIAHARLRATALVDEDTTLAIMPDYGPTGFTLLDAYAVRALGEGWSVQVGQFKPAFGDDRYLTPVQFKRTNYYKLDSFAFPGTATVPTNTWDMGVEVKKVSEHLTFQADLVQGAGPNKTADDDKFKDLAGRLEWKEGPLAIGASYYGGTNNGAGVTAYSNWGGAHLRFNQDGMDLRAEGILAPGDRAGFAAQAAYKSGDWEPLAWYEAGFISSVQNFQVLGLGLNYWPAAKTRISLNALVNGVTDLSGKSMAVLQVEQAF